MKWSELSMKDKAAIMKVAINNGIIDLNSIKNKFDEGGQTKDNTYVAPIYKEQGFIPFKGAKKIMWDSLPKVNGRRIASGAIDIVSPEFDLLTGIRAITSLPTKAEKLGREYIKSKLIKDSEIVDLINSKRIKDLTDFGKDSDKYIHTDLGRGSSVFAGVNKGAHIVDRQLVPGEALIYDQLPYVWWNKGKRYTPLGENKHGYQAIIINKDNANDLLQVRQSKTPIGQWDGRSGFVLKSEYVTNKPVNLSSDVEHYIYDDLTKTYGNVKHYKDGGFI